MQKMHWWNGLTGLLSGLALISGIAQYWLSCGTSLPAQTGLAVMLSLMLIVAVLLRMSGRVGVLTKAGGLFVLSASTLAVPTILSMVWSTLAGAGIDPFTSMLTQVAAFTGIACVTLGVPTLCVLAVLSSRRQAVLFAIGLIHGSIILCPWLGPQGCGLIAAALGLVAFLLTIVSWSRQSEEMSDSRAGVISHAVKNETFSASRVTSAPGQCGTLMSPGANALRLADACRIISLLAVGLLWPVGQRLVRQVVPDSFALMAIEWAVLMLSATAGSAWSQRASSRPSMMSGLMAASWTSLCLAMFPVCVHLALTENANIAQVWLLMLLRLLFAAVALGPIGFCGGLLANGHRSRTQSLGAHTALLLTLLSATATSWLLPLLGVETLAMSAIGVLLLAAAVGGGWRSMNAQIRGFKTTGKWSRIRLGFVGLMILLAISGPALRRYQPALAAKVLFDTTVFMAHRGGAPWEQLAVMDDCRAVVVAESERGTLTAWKARGSQFLIRENGIPKGTLATNAEFAPRYLPDVLPSLLPLVVHEQPQRVLLLGMRVGEPLVTATAFPVQRVLCLEADRGVVTLCRQLLEPSGTSSPFADDRVEMRISEPSVAVRTLKEKFDVVISSPDQPSLSQAAVWFTEESIRAAANCVNEDGLFALRFQHVDLTTKSVRVVAKTMTSVFREVAAVEMAPGELLFLGTNSERGFAREGFVDRLQRPHVRQMLASVGWDWSTPLRLGLQNAEAIETLTAHHEAVSNVSSRSTWPFQLPIDVMRWENKLEKTRIEMAKNTRFLMLWGGHDADTPDVATRISEWDLSRKIIRLHPDEYWAYRKQVKDHLTKSQRAIQQVSLTQTESGLHPDDDRRLRYFRAIGEVTKNAHPTEADLARIRRFESPFDPLVSQFLHQEVIELTPRCADRDVATELRHRLAGIYFSTNADRSIRNVTDALQFLNSTPDAIPNQAERFDHLNALMQMLSNRWLARGEFSPTTSRVALNDIERSIAAMEASFTTVDGLVSAGAVPAADWTARRQFLERRVVRPLRTYRGEVLKHYVKNERTREAAASVVDTIDVPSSDTTATVVE